MRITNPQPTLKVCLSGFAKRAANDADFRKKFPEKEWKKFADSQLLKPRADVNVETRA